MKSASSSSWRWLKAWHDFALTQTADCWGCVCVCGFWLVIILFQARHSARHVRELDFARATPTTNPGHQLR
jgi:hypothetical protein